MRALGKFVKSVCEKKNKPAQTKIKTLFAAFSLLFCFKICAFDAHFLSGERNGETIGREGNENVLVVLSIEEASRCWCG